MTDRWATLDGNEAAALVAYALSEVIAIYPITPASSMGELADAWSAAGRPNRWGLVPEVVEMQSEAGAAGALHGALQTGSLATTFTASQGLLLMLPNMFKIAGELTPAVIHVAARAVATHALSIFGDHSDVMAARTTGWAMLCASSVQEAHDFALVAHAAALRCRVPFLHFFDGFRTSHEVARIQLLGDDDLTALVREGDVLAHRERQLTPDHPVVRGTAQNPDVFFQAREAANGYYDAVPGAVRELFDQLAARTGRRYDVVEYVGAPDAERVVVVMGSAAGTLEETVEALTRAGERVGVLKVRLYRPFPGEDLVRALPPTVRSIAVLDRTKEPGALGEPLYQDVVTALAEQSMRDPMLFAHALPRVIGGRYGLASKEFTPAMAKAVFEELLLEHPRIHVTAGIVDDVTGLSVTPDPQFRVDTGDGLDAVFFGLGSDGTVGANKNAVKLVSEELGLFAQGYFVYDSKKSGSVTVSHLRFRDHPIRSEYLVDQADFVACHQFTLVDRVDVLELAAPAATFLLNSPYGPDDVWDHLPVEVQHEIIDKHIDLWVVDAHRVAREVGLPGRINAVMQPAFLALAGMLPRDRMIELVKASFAKEYAKRGPVVVERNLAAVDRALDELHQVKVPAEVRGTHHRRPAVTEDAPDFVARVTAAMLAGHGDRLPVSAMPVDGTFPSGTARFEKRAIALDLPSWDPSLCIDCGKCTLVCPHAAIRMKVFDDAVVGQLPEGFLRKPFRSKEAPGLSLAIQVSPDDCTGCGVCVDVCPAKSKTDPSHKSLDMVPVDGRADVERERYAAFAAIPEADRSLLSHDTVKGTQLLQPLFEFSGACAGCGETPYLKLLSQLFGDRMLIANATGCSSIYGGNLPTTPWSTNAEGRGPAWANSLFEDNAEFGLGMRLAVDRQRDEARQLLHRLAPAIGEELVDELLAADEGSEAGVAAQRARVEALRARLQPLIATDGEAGADARRLDGLADELVRKSVWIVGGDGWAYDIGFGGLDHVLASGRDVNIMVLDTEVYSNTGGQASKATPRAAVAKFAASGKRTGKKDLGLLAMSYGNVYVAQIAMGASDIQTVKALQEAEAWPGPSLIIAYSTCIAHGIDMATSMHHQKDAARSGYWPLYRYRPGVHEHEHPFQLDSHKPAIGVKEMAMTEGRFAQLARSRPEEAEKLLDQAQADIDERWRFYEQLAGVERTSTDND
jgi:pyruvate-ferredoxin/flavodoxin oxidoreductase